MADISLIRIGYRSGSTSGWGTRNLYQVGSNIYLVGIRMSSPFRIMIMKSTDDGETWTEMDSANAPVQGAATSSFAAQMPLSGTTSHMIYVACRPTVGDSRELALRRFDTTTDTWETTNYGGGLIDNRSLATRPVSILVRSDNDVVAHYTYSTSSTHRWARYEGTSWSILTYNGSTTHYVIGSVMTANADMGHIIVTESTAPSIAQATITETNGNTGHTLDALTIVTNVSIPYYVDDGGTHRIGAIIPDSDGTGKFVHYISSASPTINSVPAVAPTTSPIRNTGNVVVAYDGKWYAFWGGGGTSLPEYYYYDVSDNLATPTFSGEPKFIGKETHTTTALSALAASDGVFVAFQPSSAGNVITKWIVKEGYGIPSMTFLSAEGTVTATAEVVVSEGPITSGPIALEATSDIAITQSTLRHGSAALESTATCVTNGRALNNSYVVVSWVTFTIPEVKLSGPVSLDVESSSNAQATNVSTRIPIGGLIRVAGDEPIAWSVFHDILLWQLTRTAPNDIIFTANRTESTLPIIVTRQAVDL